MIRALLFLIALAAGGAALWLYLQQTPPEVVEEAPPAPPEVLAPAMVSVLAAMRDIERDEPLGSDSVDWIDWPQDFVLPTFIRQDAQPEAQADMTGWRVRDNFSMLEPLRRDALRPPGPNPLSELLAPGMRALAVRVTTDATAGGFILPGDRVDVLHTRMRPGADDVESRVIASNVRVIALDQRTQPEDAQSLLVERTATLELEPGLVERVTSAQQSGALSLALRALADQDEPPRYAPPAVRIFRGGELSIP